MNIIVCIDDKCGMLFGGRRLSRDIRLCENILEVVNGDTLYMNEYSYGLFETLSAKNIKVNESFLKKAKANDYCFVENASIEEYAKSINKVLLYRWNRVYPSDVKFDMSVLEDKKLLSTTEFAGNSHDKITLEVYK